MNIHRFIDTVRPTRAD